MWNKHKWRSLLLAGLVLLLASSVVACGRSYTQEDLDKARQTGFSAGLAQSREETVTPPPTVVATITPTPTQATSTPVPTPTPTPTPTATPTPSPIARYTLVTHSPSVGYVKPSGGTYDSGASVTLTASPNPGYRFLSWSGDASGTSPTITVTMDSDKTLAANFAPLFTLKTSFVPADPRYTPDEHVKRIPDKTYYEDGERVTLQAIPFTGFDFLQWSGDVISTSATITVTMDSNKIVVAHFADTLPLRAFDVRVSTVTDTSATVMWNMSKQATCQIEYGTTTPYGSTSPANVVRNTARSLTLTGLQPKTTYQFRVKSTDTSGNIAFTGGTFTTKTVEELLSALLYPGITSGGYVQQLGYGITNGSSITITVTKVEFFDKNGSIKHSVSESTIQGAAHKGQLLSGNTFNWSVSFQTPYSTEEIKGWQVKWYCLDANGVQFTVTGRYTSL